MDDRDRNGLNSKVSQMPAERQHTAASRAEYMRRKGAHEKLRRKRRRQAGAVIIIVLVLLVLGIVLICRGCSSDRSIVGTWDYDTVTVYRFDKNGKGALILPNASYDFSYTTKDGKISIDFESEQASDSTYTYTVKADKLTLTVDEASDTVYVLTKKQ